MNDLTFQIGEQITYIPQEANGDPDHPRSEDGFVVVMHPDPDYAWCRFWFKDSDEIRTTNTSEKTPVANLIHRTHHDQRLVIEFIKEHYTFDLEGEADASRHQEAQPETEENDETDS